MFAVSLRLPGLNEVPHGARATCACQGWLLTYPAPGAGSKLEPTVPPSGLRQKQALSKVPSKNKSKYIFLGCMWRERSGM